jgi:uncharacterized protein (DUF362 family)
MKKISRRKFLSLLTRSTGAAAVLQLLEACGVKPAAAPGTPTYTPFGSIKSSVDNGISIANAQGPTSTASPSNTNAPTSESATETSLPAAEPAYLAVARGGDDPEALTRAAIAAIGGMGKFVPKGANVLIKPNYCVDRKYEYAATTNPWVVAALVKMSLDAGAAKVLVFDFPFGGPSNVTAKTSGIAEQAMAAGGQMEYVDNSKFIATDLPNGHSLHSAAFYSEVTNADVVINVPIAKNHSTTGLTLGMKNMMGTVKNRPAIHADIHRMIADLAAYVRPELTVVDAMRILTDHGPEGQNNTKYVLQMNTVIASADIVAADAYATRLFGAVDPGNHWHSFYSKLQEDPNNLGYIKFGAEWGLGRSDLANLNIAEIKVG